MVSAWSWSGAMILGLALSSGCQEDACVSPDRPEAAAGERVWEQAFTAEDSDFGRGVAVERCGGQVLVTATLRGAAIASEDAWFGGLTSLGEPRWDKRIHELFDERAAAVVDDGEGGWIVAGQAGVSREGGHDVDAGWLLRFEADGAEVWRAHMVDEDEEGTSFVLENLALGDDGVIVVAGSKRNLYQYQRAPLAAAYTATGELLWSYARDPADGIGSLRAALPLPDSSDTLFVGSLETGEGRGLFVVRLSVEGEVLSELHRLDIPIGSAPAVLMPEGASMLITAASSILEIDLDGAVLQEHALEEAEHAFAFAVDGSEGIYVVGRRQVEEWVFHPWILRMSRDLSRTWEVTEPRQGQLSGVAVGPMGDAFVVGTVEAPPTGERLDFNNDDVWIARFAR